MPQSKLPNLPDRCLELVRALRDSLGEPPRFTDDAVHQLRVLTKRLRAAWSLATPSAGRAVSKSRRDALRELSARFAGTRDQSVLRKLAKELAKDDGVSPAEMASFDRIATRHPDVSTEPGITSEDEIERGEFALQALDAEAAAWGELSKHPPPLKSLREVVDKTQARAARAAHTAIATDDADTWHEWRKLVKRLRYQREFLADLRGEKTGKKDAGLKHLGTLLGKRNDLDNLKRLLVDSERDGATLKKSVARVDAREGRLIDEARTLGRTIFPKKG